MSQPELTVMTPTGCIGNRGIHRQSFVNGLAEFRPDVIATDAGSLDPGPWYLGAGKPHSPTHNVLWDLELLLTEAVPQKLPVVIGTAGGSGAREHVDTTIAQIRSLAAKHDLHFKLATIYADVDHAYLRERAATEQIPAVDHEGFLTPEMVDAATTVVAMMGHEPLIAALELGADVIVAGRASDAAVIAAYPIWKGYDLGLSLHLGDIMECGESSAVELDPILRGELHNRIPIIGRIRDDHILIRPANRALACTPQSCAAHSLYERSSIYSATLPGGVLDKRQSVYHEEDAWTTRVSGTKFTPNDLYTVLLEGVRPIGYRSVFIFGVRNPRMLAQLDSILSEMRAREIELFGTPSGVQVNYHVYGRDGVLGSYEFERTPAHEAGVVVDVVAPTQELAHDIADDVHSRVAFWRYPGRQTTAGNVAMTFSPSVMDAGEVFDLDIYHALAIPDGRSIFPVQLEQL